jgi:hypothetical protein
MCPAVSTGRRRRLHESFGQDVSDMSVDHPHYRYWEKQLRRRLDFDYEGEGNDDDSELATVADFGVIVTSIGEEFKRTFGSPGAFSMESGLPVLVSVSFLVILFAAGIVYFHRWDLNELYTNRYVTVGMSTTLSQSLNKGPSFFEAFVINDLDIDDSEESYESVFSDNGSDDEFSPRGGFESFESIDFPCDEDDFPDEATSSPERAVSQRTASLQKEMRKAFLSAGSTSFASDDNDSPSRPSSNRSSRSDRSNRTPLASPKSSRPNSLMKRQKGRKHIHTEEELGTVPIIQHVRKLWRVVRRSFRRMTHHLHKVFKKVPNAALKVHVPTIAEVHKDYKLQKEKSLNTIVSQTHDGKAEEHDTITTFLERSLPPSVTLNEKNGFKRFFSAILREHDWLRCFTYSSSRFPRVIRFLVVFTNVIILFFVDSLFFAILFPTDNECEGHSGVNGGTEDMCLERASDIKAGTKYCTWDENTGVCELRPPPSDIVFFIIVSVLVTLMSIVPATLCESMLINVCAMRPRFSESESHLKHNVTESCLGAHVRNIKITGQNINRLMEVYTYFQMCSVEDEVNSMLASLEGALAKGNATRKLPWSTAALESDLLVDSADAVKESMGLDDNGNPLPLSFVQKLFFKNPRKRVEWKVKKAREEADEILDDLDLFVDGEEDLMDVLIIQKFILEQLTPFRRYALQAEFFQFDGAAPAFVNGYIWLISWLTIILTWIFCVSWLFFWAVNNGSGTIDWGLQICFVLMQDIFINEIVQIFVVNILTIELLRPQLRQIYDILHVVLREKMDASNTSRDSEVMIRIVQHMSAACRVAHTPSLRHLPAAQLLCKVNDHDVKLCRASRASELGWFIKFLVGVQLSEKDRARS